MSSPLRYKAIAFNRDIDFCLYPFTVFVFQDAFWLLSKVLFTYIVTVIPQHSPCQIQSFYARQFGSGQGNLLRVHLNQNDVPTNVTFTGSCVNATLGFTGKLTLYFQVVSTIEQIVEDISVGEL